MAATGFDAVDRQMAASEAQVAQMMDKYKELTEMLEVRTISPPVHVTPAHNVYVCIYFVLRCRSVY